MVRVLLPFHLRTLAGVEGEVQLEVPGVVSWGAIVDAIEAKYPTLRGTIRDHGSVKRRAMVRFFACEEDWSNEPPDAALPSRIAEGREVFLVIGALAGG